MRIHFGRYTEKEIYDLTCVLHRAMVKFTEKHRPTIGLSIGTGHGKGGGYDLYSAIDDAIYGQWNRAKKSLARLRREQERERREQERGGV